MINLINTILPVILAAWRALRDADPNAPTYTDDQVLEMLSMSSGEIVAKANAWLESHPPTP